MVKTSSFNAWVVCSIPDHATKIPHASWPKKTPKQNRSNIATILKTLKMVHIKKIFLKRYQLLPMCQEYDFYTNSVMYVLFFTLFQFPIL